MDESNNSGVDIFEPYKRLIAVDILGEEHLVPENNTILRCLQFLDMEKISGSDLCWNGDCLNCQVWVASGEKEKALISCRAKVEEGMRIVRVSPEIA